MANIIALSNLGAHPKVVLMQDAQHVFQGLMEILDWYVIKFAPVEVRGQNGSACEILGKLKQKYPDQIRSEVTSVRVLHENRRCLLEIWESHSDGSRIRERAIRDSLEFISKPTHEGGPTFDASESVALNAQKFLRDVDVRSLAICTTLFAREPKGDLASTIAPSSAPTQEPLLSIPTVEQYKQAIVAVRVRLSEEQLRIIKAHFIAPKQTATMTQLANAIGRDTYRAGNVIYGNAAAALCKALGRNPSTRLSAMVTFQKGGHDVAGQWLLVMRPQVVKALRQLQWF